MTGSGGLAGANLPCQGAIRAKTADLGTGGGGLKAVALATRLTLEPPRRSSEASVEVQRNDAHSVAALTWTGRNAMSSWE